MATDTERISSLKALADSTGLIYDRALLPEKVIGQCWLISKGRVVTLASSVANFAEAPWALSIRFPHPDVSFGVRTVTLHPDFNKREARDFYLAQAQGPQIPFLFENDIATVALDMDLAPVIPEKLAEINRALALPFDIAPNDMSGALRPGDAVAVLQSALSTGRSGLISMVDARNIPFARIVIKQARIVRASFNNLFNEVAICELLWRKPAGNFAFQPIDNPRWPADIPEITTGTDQIFTESARRCDELPRVIEMLGGPDVRFQKSTSLADFSQINAAERRVAEQLWECVDGYLPLSKVPDRVGADSYTCIKLLWDFATMGLINVNTNKIFSGSGQLGPMLVPAQDLELSTWDTLNAFYLEPTSACPVLMQGNFFGPAHVINNKTLLHTMALPSNVQTAAILKDGKLVGIHAGPYAWRVNNPPPLALQNMMWVGALNDLGTKRLRTAEASDDELDEAADMVDPSTSQRLLGLRNRDLGTGAQTSASNVTTMPVEETGPLAKYSKQQILVGAGAVTALSLIMMLVSLCSPHGEPTAVQPAPTTTAASVDTATSTAASTGTAGTQTVPATDVASAKIAAQIAGFKGRLDSAFVYKDTAKITEPKLSFGLTSDLKNVDMVFVEWPNMAPCTDIVSFAVNVPFLNYHRSSNKSEFTNRTQNTTYSAGRYSNDKNESFTCVIGAFPGVNPGKSVVFIAKPLSGEVITDVSLPSTIVEKMLVAPPTPSTASAAAPADAPTDSANLASATQLADYRKKLQAVIKTNYHRPKAEDDADTKVGLAFTVDSKGAVTNLILKPSNPDEDFNAAIQKAFEATKPLPPCPSTKSGKYALLITASDDGISVDEQ